MGQLQRPSPQAHGAPVDDAEYEVVQGRSLATLVKAETDVQITTAKAYPRSIRAFKDMATEMACLDEETAASCRYELPRSGKKLEGPSVRLAEIVASAWGNLRSGARVIDDDGKMIVAQGFAWDLERNVMVTTEVRRRVTTKDGRRFSDDMVIVTCNAACAIAFRNALFKVVPMAYTRDILVKAKEVARGDAKTLTERREMVLDYFATLGVDEKRVLALIHRRAADDITLDDLLTLKGVATAIKDGEITAAEAFPAPGGAASQDGRGQRVAEALAGPAGDKKDEAGANGTPSGKPVDPVTHYLDVIATAKKADVIDKAVADARASEAVGEEAFQAINRAANDTKKALAGKK